MNEGRQLGRSRPGSVGRRAALLWLCAIVALPASVALAGPPSDFVREKQSALCAALEASTPAEARVAAIFDEMIDYGALARASLGDDWAVLTSAQQTEFTGLLRLLVMRAYEKQLKKTAAYRFEYPGETKADDGSWLVKTVATHKTDKREDPISLDFRLEESDKGVFHAVDIIVEDVSLVESYRAQFTKILRRDGAAALIAKLKEKLGKG